MPSVKVRENEPFEYALRRFKRSCEKAGILAETLNETQVSNLATYFVSLPSEVAMKLWTVLGDTDNIENGVALHKAESATGQKVSEHLVDILGGSQ